MIPKNIQRYLGGLNNLSIFVFYNLKLLSINNIYLAMKLAWKIRKYDVIHLNGINGIFPFMLLLLWRKKKIFSIHDIQPHSGEVKSKKFVEKLVDYLCKSKYPIIIMNKYDYESCLRKYKRNSKFYYIPLGLSEIYTYYKPTKLVPSDVLFFGRIAEYKGLKYLIDALRILKDSGYQFSTLIAGDGKYGFDESECAQVGITVMNKRISNEELADIIMGTKIVVCPYLDATQSGVLMTAFAFDKPVIASDVGSFRDVLKENTHGLLVQPKDAKALAQAIIKIIENPELMDDFIQNIKARVNLKEYEWEEIAKKTLLLYENIVQ
jgi:glycosyltransferase involved in cell wall biosynthesis